MKLIIASNNQHKVTEIRAILGGLFDEIVSQKEAGIVHETVEDGTTFLANAEKKAREIAALSGCCALADDSGLSVDALGCGRHGDDTANNRLLLERMRDVRDRGAHYTCAVVLATPDGRTVSAEDYFYGEIAREERGMNGFGYDPLFYLPERGCTAAELPPEIKNGISHRSRALRALAEKLRSFPLP